MDFVGGIFVKLEFISAMAIGLFLVAGCSEERSPLESSPGSSDVEEELSPSQLRALSAEDEAKWTDDSPTEVPEQALLKERRDHDDDQDEDHHDGVSRSSRSYEITLENLTPVTGAGSSQPFSPPVLASHHRSFRLFRVGHRASSQLAQIAQDAQNGPMVSLLEDEDAVHAVTQGSGVILPGSSDRFTIETARGARSLSLAFMLVNTNDGFGGVSGLRLPRHGSLEVEIYAYDAGSEANTELIADIPGPCCGNPFSGTPTHEKIRRHAGIRGDADLAASTYGWSGPIARLTIRRLEPAYSVVVENLTPATGPGSSQVFSPPVIATHARGIRMFRVGHFASAGLAKIAEDAMNGPMLNRFETSSLVHDVQEGSGVIPPGASAAYTVHTAPGFRRLSMAFMLVNTNDGFGGVDSIFLPRGGRRSYYFRAYDAGSEANTELAADIPGPCCGSPGAGTPTHERIRRHRGIRGIGDLDPDLYGWEDAAVKITITRLR